MKVCGSLRTLIVMVLLIAPLMALVGCKGPRQFDITVRLDDSLLAQPPSLDVDIVGVGSGDASLRAVSLDEYFTPRSDGTPSQIRSDLEGSGQKVTMEFQAGNSEPKTLSKSDAIWGRWKRNNIMELMVIVEVLPGTANEAAHRLFIPLDGKRWERRDNQLTITIQRSRLDLRPQPLP